MPVGTDNTASMPRAAYRPSRAAPAVIVVTALFVVFFGLSNWFRQVNLQTAQFDMGNMDQVLWHTLHGHWFQLTDPGSGALIPRSAIHTDFLLLIYLPFYTLFQDPRTPLVLQVLAVASGVIPLYLLARKKIGAPAGAFMSVLYLLYPTLEWAVTFDVHAVVLATPLFLWAWWAATERRWRVYYAAISLALLGKEEVGLTVAAIGVYWGWRRGYRTMGIVSVLLGIGWTALMLGVVIPFSRAAPGHFAFSYYSDFGSSYSEVLRNVLSHPIDVLVTFFKADRVLLLGQLLLPVGLVALAGLPVLLVALPELAVNFLSSNSAQHSIFFHYMSVVTPFVLLAAVDGWNRARRLRVLQGRRGVVAVGAIVLLAAVAVWRWSPLPGLRYGDTALRVFRPSPYRDDVMRVTSLLKPEDRVAATNNLAPQFSRRDRIWGFPNRLEDADAVIVLEGGDFELLPRDEISAEVQALAENPSFTLVYRHDQFWYFRRAGM